MASVKRRIHTAKDGKKSTYWRLRYIDPSGRERSENFDRKADADRRAIDVESSKMRGAYIDPAEAKVPFDDVARAWRANMVARPSTLNRVDSVLKKHIVPGFEGRALGDIVPSEVQAWVKRCEQAGLAPRSIEVIYRYLSSIFKTAVLDGRIVRSPCIGIRLPKIQKVWVQPLATEQVAALIEAMPPRYRALIWVGAGAGLRQGEALGLTVPHLEFLKRNVVVAQQLQQVVGQPLSLAPPKTESSVRSIPVGESVLTALARHLEPADRFRHCRP